jgi:anti-sigma B factor antagonist
MSLTVDRVEYGLERMVRLALDGRLDTATAPDLEKQLKDIFSRTIGFLLFDLRNLSYISSAGIRTILFAHQEMAQRKGKVLITNLQPQIQQVMDVIGVLPALAVLGTEEEADEYLAKIQKDAIHQKEKNPLGL